MVRSLALTSNSNIISSKDHKNDKQHILSDRFGLFLPQMGTW